MKNILETLYDSYYQPQDFSTQERRIADNHKRLVQALNKKHRRLVLRIIDDKDQIINSISYDSFVQGVMFGLSFREELDHYKSCGEEND